MAVIVFFFQLYWFEMASNAIKGDFRLSKMASSDHFMKNIWANDD